MSKREDFHPATERSGRFALEWSLGGRRKRIELSPLALGGLGAAALAAGILAPCVAAYLAFHDDTLAELVVRQSQMRYAYEDRLATLRLQLDQATRRQFIDQDGVEGKVQNLVVRQAKLETRTAAVARLVEGVAAKDILALARRSDGAPRSAAAPAPPLPPSARAYVSPMEDRPAAFATTGKPEPEGMDLRLGHGDEALGGASPKRRMDRNDVSAGLTDLPRSRSTEPSRADAADSADPLQARLERLAVSLDRVEREQTARVASLVEPMREAARKLRRAFDAAGLPIERYVPKAATGAESPVGGPYVPADRKTSDLLFEHELFAAQSAVTTLESLRRALPTVPLRKPLTGELETTSTFGYRTDPFLGRPALHTGIDLRDDYGAPVCATAAGVVVTAGPNGGYGYMVEVDHGGGLTTRYAHLASISATVGQQLAVGAMVGRVGSTGRSTGPHLHYEVRMDGEPVDPSRFLRAAATLAETR